MTIRLASMLVLALSAAGAAEPALTGTWVGDKPIIASGAVTVLAMYDRNGTCCGGPAAALAGLGNLRTALKERSSVVLVAVDVTAGATAEKAGEAAKLHHTDGIPLLVDGDRATAKAMTVEIDMTMTYVIRQDDGTQVVVHSPNQVKKKLGL